MPQLIKNRKFNFTVSRIDGLELPDSGQVIYHDTGVPGLVLRATPTKKVYCAESRVKAKGKKRRVKIGVPGAWTVETARARAQELIGDMARGIDPNQEIKKGKAQAQANAKMQEQAQAITLSSVWNEYRQARNLRPRTLQVYESALQCCFKDWLNLPLTQITKDMVQRRYEKLLAKGWKAQSHLAMRTLRSIMNYAAAVHENGQGESLLKVNPVKRLSEAKLWRPLAMRTSVIPVDKLKTWYRAVKKVKPDSRDLLLVALWTGLRRNEITRLMWTDIDLNRDTLKIRAENSKNHQEHILPLSKFLKALLTARSHVQDIRNPYVFPGSNQNKDGHLVEPKRNIQAIKAATNIEFSMHDIRRTFISVAERLVPGYTLKRLVNHRDTNDVTARYVIRSVDDLRDDVEKISTFLIGKTGAKIQASRAIASGQSKVVALKARAQRG